MTDSAKAYEANAYEFLKGRDASPIGTRVVRKWSRTLQKDASVIELACGGGYPVTKTLAAEELRIWAIDSSSTLVAEFRSRFPGIPVKCERVQESDFFGQKYDAAIAIGLVFLLSKEEQANLISRVSRILMPKGRFLFMAPIQKGTWKDLNTGIECISLGQERYEELLRDAGFKVVATYMDKGENNYYDTQKIE